MLRICNTSCRGYQGCSKGEGVLLRVYCNGSLIPRVFQGEGLFKEYIVPCRGYPGWSKGEGVFLRVYCIVSRIPRVV